MERWVQGGLSIAFAVALGTSVSAAGRTQRVGEMRAVPMAAIDMIGSINGELSRQIGGPAMTGPAVHTRVSRDVSVTCGFYVSLDEARRDAEGAAQRPYVIISNKRTIRTEVLAPVTGAEQEDRGCYPGDRAGRARMNPDFARARGRSH